MMSVTANSDDCHFHNLVHGYLRLFQHLELWSVQMLRDYGASTCWIDEWVSPSTQFS